MTESQEPRARGPRERGTHETEPTEAKVKPHGRVSPVWLIPIVAAALVAYLGYSSIAHRGTTITLVLATADGLTIGQTEVKHKAVTVGKVDSIRLAPDMKSVVVEVRMVADTERLLTDHARFWVVRPRLSAGSLTGIETLVSGPYIEVDPGAPAGKKQRDFKALPQPPGRQSDEPGQVFVLKAKQLGSLGDSSPVYYRDVEVGEVLSYDLGDGLGPVSLRVFVREPYDKMVHTQTRFWNASGLSVTMGAEGMRLELQSIQTLLSGGIAFETPPIDKDPPADEATPFDLYPDKASADNAIYVERVPYVTYFTTSVLGLASGAPVRISGVQVGSVSDVKLVYDGAQRRMIARVAFSLQPERILTRGVQNDAAVSADVRRAFSDRGMHVVLEASNLLTGAKDLSIEYGKQAAGSGELQREDDAIVLPSQGGGIDDLTASLADVAAKLDKVPFQEIGDNASATLRKLDRLVGDIEQSAVPALARLPEIEDQMVLAAKNANGALGAGGYGPNSDFQRDMQRLMREVNDTARSFRGLADYLDRHPEALLRGRMAQAGGR